MMLQKLSKTAFVCAFAVLCLAVLGGPAARAAAEGPEPALYGEERINQYSKYFTNHVDGYRLMVQNSMQADMSLSSVRTVLSNDNDTIEIYAQEFGPTLSWASYLYYGNLFIREYPFYETRYDGYMTLAGLRAHVLEWSRPALSRVENDKRFYACVDMPLPDGRALTFLFKSAQPFEQFDSKYYILVLNTLTLEERTAEAVDRRTEAVENPWWNEETRALYETYFAPDSPLTWGIYSPGAPLYDSPQFHAAEEAVAHEFRFLLEYSDIDTYDPNDLKTMLDNAARDGRTVELTLQTTLPEESNVLMDVLDGKYDEYLNGYAAAVAANGKPVLFRPCNEMNGDWCIYSAFHTSKDTDLYKAFYRYLHHIFEENGALANTIWVWNPNARSYPNFDWNHALCYYPGDEYVDVVGLTGYNTGTYYPSERWRSFSEIYDTLYREYDARHAQPLMITEFACSGIGGDKAEWVRDMLDRIEGYERIKVAVWWSSCDFDAKGNVARPYFIDDDPGVLEAFRAYFAERDKK